MIPLDTPAGKDNCGIAAVALLAGVSYREAEHLFVTLCAKSEVTTVWERREVIDHLGLTVLQEIHYRDKPALKTWVRRFYDPHYPYLVSMTGHAVAVKNGLLYDQVYRCGIPPMHSPYQRKLIHSYMRLDNDPDQREVPA